MFLSNTRLLNACRKIAALPCDMWTNRTKEWVDFNVKLVYKACLNHSHRFLLLVEKETHTSVKIHRLKGVLLFINIHKKSWNHKRLLSIFDKAYFEQESVFEETK